MKPDRNILEVRVAQVSDVVAISCLLTELGFPSSETEVAERLHKLPDAVLVASVEGAVVGVVTTNIMPVLHRPSSVGRLSALVVSAQDRRGGIGRALVSAAEKLLTAAGCELVEVTSNFQLEEAHKFYR